jgi:hypothetical protein
MSQFNGINVSGTPSIIEQEGGLFITPLSVLVIIEWCVIGF